MRQKGFTPLIIIVVIVILGIVGYLGYKSFKPSIQETTPPTPITTDPITKWKIYSGNFFSFEYPDNYTVTLTDDSEMVILDGEIGDNIEETYIDWREGAYSNITIDQEITKMKKTDIVKQEKKITLGIDLIVTENGLLGGQFGVGKSDARVLILDSKQNRLIKLTTNTQDSIPGGEIDKIIPTFKFFHSAPTTNPFIDTSNWKTYNNEDLGFSYKYPNDWQLGNSNSFYITNKKDGTIIQIHRYQASELPKGYTSVATWFTDLSNKRQKAVLPNNGYYYGPGSDTPYEWYMYYDFDNFKNTKVDGIASLVTYSNIGLMYIVVPTKNYVYEITVNPTKAYGITTVNQILSTFKFTQ